MINKLTDLENKLLKNIKQIANITTDLELNTLKKNLSHWADEYKNTDSKNELEKIQYLSSIRAISLILKELDYKNLDIHDINLKISYELISIIENEIKERKKNIVELLNI